MEKKKSINVWITGLTSLFTDISSEMVYPIISLYIKALGGGAAVLGLIEGLAESTASLLKVFSGAIADKVGKRKPLAISGYSLSAIGKFLFYLARSWAWVLAGRVVDRIGKGTRTAPRDALIAESIDTSRRGRAFGLHRSLDTAGAVVGILIAYFILRYLNPYKGNLHAMIPAFRTIILFSLIPAIIGVVILFFAVETGTGKKQRKLPLHWKAFKTFDVRLKAVLIIAFVFTLGNSSNQFILLRAVEPDLGFNPANVILLYLLYNIVYMMVSYPSGRLSDSVGRKPLIVVGFLTYGITYFIIALWPWLIWLAMVVYGLYSGMTEGVMKAFISELSPQDKRATVLGLYATIEGIGLLPASLIAGWLWASFGHSAPFFFGGATGVLASLLLLVFI